MNLKFQVNIRKKQIYLLGVVSLASKGKLGLSLKGKNPPYRKATKIKEKDWL